MNSSSVAHFSVPHFTTGPFEPVCTRLPDDIYAQILDNVTKVTHDILILTHDDRLLLGERCVYPQKDWWFACGGRAIPGETPIDACRRLLRRELDLHFEVDELASRLEHLSAFSFHWARREQQPHPERGTCDVSCIHAIYVSAEEAAHAIAHLDPKEYAQIAYVDFDSVIAADSKFHPAVQRAVHGILDRRRFRALEAAIANTAAQDDQAIVQLAREYVRGKQSVTAGDRVPIKTLDFL